MENAILLYATIVESAIPYALVFVLGGKIVNTFIDMAFHGKVEI